MPMSAWVPVNKGISSAPQSSRAARSLDVACTHDTGPSRMPSGRKVTEQVAQVRPVRVLWSRHRPKRGKVFFKFLCVID